MTYKRSDFGKGLLKQLESGYDVDRLARWAFSEHADHCLELESGLDAEMMSIIAMGEGPEFHYSEQELRHLIANLMGTMS